MCRALVIDDNRQTAEALVQMLGLTKAYSVEYPGAYGAFSERRDSYPAGEYSPDDFSGYKYAWGFRVRGAGLSAPGAAADASVCAHRHLRRPAGDRPTSIKRRRAGGDHQTGDDGYYGSRITESIAFMKGGKRREVFP